MSYKININSNHLVVKTEGRWDLDNMKKLIDDSLVAADKNKISKVLLDFTKVSSPEDEMTRFHSAVYAAEKIQKKIKVAVLINIFLYNSLAENVAVNRGANLKVFFYENEALGWLLSSD